MFWLQLWQSSSVDLPLCSSGDCLQEDHDSEAQPIILMKYTEPVYYKFGTVFLDICSQWPVSLLTAGLLCFVNSNNINWFHTILFPVLHQIGSWLYHWIVLKSWKHMLTIKLIIILPNFWFFLPPQSTI